MSDLIERVEKQEVYGIPLKALPAYRKAEPVGNNPTVVEIEVNKELLLEILEFIKSHPQTWNQGTWFKTIDLETGVYKYSYEVVTVQEINSCGSSMCFAGHVALHEGFPPPPKANGALWERTVVNPDDIWDDFESVDQFARARLGLDTDQADELFDEANDLIALENMVNGLVWFDADWRILADLRSVEDLLTKEDMEVFIADNQ